MKKAGRSLAIFSFSLFFSLILTLSVMTPVSAAGGKSDESQVFSYLTRELGFNSAASCGIMSNIEHESDFNPRLVIIDCNGRPSGGLCQWNGGRFSSLMNYCSSNGFDYLSIQGQLEYLKHELQGRDFKHIYDYMKNVPNTKEGAYNAGYYWCYYFVIPSNRASRSSSRASAAVNNYWPVYCVNDISAVKPVSKADDKTLDLDRRINVSWNKASGNYTGYIAYVAQKIGDEFDWDHAKQISLGKNDRRVTLDLSDLGIGRFAVRVFAQNDINGYKGDCDNTVKFNVACLDHRFAPAKRVEPGFTHDGKKVVKCEKCGETQTTVLPKLSQPAFENGEINGFEVTGRTDDTVSLAWKAFRGAEGYRIYQLSDGEWVKLRRMEADELTCTVKNLKPGTRYTFKVAAFAKKGDDAVYCKGADLSVFTRPTGVKLTNAESKQDKVWLQWNAGKKAEGYSVFASENPDRGFEEVRSVNAETTKTGIGSLRSGVRYYFYVCTYITNAKGGKVYSFPSNILSAEA